MKRAWMVFLIGVLLGGVGSSTRAAEQHRATHLGNPETRFAPPLTTIDDLRSRFRDERLKPDIAEVLRQWGWQGKLEDLFRASQMAEVRDVSLSKGTIMPFMSSRENGRPICLRNVVWAGKEPVSAYVFNFTSNGRNYRCVTPKPCSNFYVEDLGPEPVPALAIRCEAPGEALPGRPIELCFTISNPGTGWVRGGVVQLPLPPNATVISASEGGLATQNEVLWRFSTLAPKATQKLCARVSAPNPGTIEFAARASATNVAAVQASCSTKIIGVPAVLIDTVDLEDPIQVGDEVTYEIKVTNQGSSELTRVRLAFILPPNEEFISGGGPTPVARGESSIATDPLPILAAKDVAVWRVVVKALQPGDVRFTTELTTDQFATPIRQEESTKLY